MALDEETLLQNRQICLLVARPVHGFEFLDDDAIKVQIFVLVDFVMVQDLGRQCNAGAARVVGIVFFVVI